MDWPDVHSLLVYTLFVLLFLIAGIFIIILIYLLRDIFHRIRTFNREECDRPKKH